SVIEKSRTYKVGLHFCLNYGLSRKVLFYTPAKEEDIRNAQWYSDNNIVSEEQLNGTQQFMPMGVEETGIILPHQLDDYPQLLQSDTASPVNQYAWTTLSRYARKLRNHLEAKVKAAFAHLKEKQQENHDLLMVISAPGEAELNFYRMNTKEILQTYFCDFSPFAVLEFRDWIKHEGMYGTGGKYEGEGYGNGGTRFQGDNGLQNFNNEFGTTFTTWKLKYYHWDLSDPVDDDYTDNFNPDPNIIPVEEYTYNGMMPSSGANFINGGFDPPRVMQQKNNDPFGDLWQTFRETMVYHYVKDMAKIARQSGFLKAQYYSHQIPADYIFGTRPDDPYLNQRYYTSASPMWTADSYSDMGMGITLYDINFRTHYANSSQYSVPVIYDMSNNWGAMEHNPEILPAGSGAKLSSVQYLYNKLVRLYDYNIHFISFYKWLGTYDFRFKGTNREFAAKQFFDDIKDKARGPINTVFTPKAVESFRAAYNSTAGFVDLTWEEKIWSDLNHTWEDWGDFKTFVIYRGYTENFQCNSYSEIVRLRGYSYKDGGFSGEGMVYYKIAAHNINGEPGTPVTVGVYVSGPGGTPVLSISRDRLNFGSTTIGTATPAQVFFITNSGKGALHWSVSDNAHWLSCSPTSGTNDSPVEVSIDASGMSPGTYKGTITVSSQDAGVVGSPKTIDVELKVYSSGNDGSPFGFFETPSHGSTVRGSIPVTGWVLDDIAVESVKIYRESGTQLIYIGDALFVEGARPDVEVEYPNYPNNYKAGWGYMMLTNFLPNQGNGAFTLRVLARDTTGHEVILGTKTITCDNAHAVKPFGTIDTPLQGGTASGRNFINWGWALTPMPNKIPINGATINVYIDGVNLGHPVYNIYRKDIADLFPGYENSKGAMGYFYLDTTKYANGVHTIAWSVRDNAGNIDGIGSRYFSIWNTDTTGSEAQSTKPGAPPVWFRQDNSLPAPEPIGIRTFYNEKGKPQPGYPDDNGVITIKIKELEQVEIHLEEVSGRTMHDQWRRTWTGFQVMGHRLGALPIGSTLDPQKGIFYWQPGPGFIGTYQFIFIRKILNNKMTKRIITVKIFPKFPGKV
ncbi:MAG: BACON domain-containing protein, partial [Candidatus Aminicenantes bacterium]